MIFERSTPSEEETPKTVIDMAPILEEEETPKTVIDMAPILKKVAPINEPFVADEEVKKLWSVSPNKRREAVSVFKDKLARQREAWALCRTIIEERIEANPDLPREEMVGIVREFASQYGFADSHVQVAESLVDDYIKIHRRVNELRKEYPDDIALINRLTGINFTTEDKKDFRVKVGPISIEITCSGFNCGRIFKKTENSVPFKNRGFASHSSDTEPYYYIVINRDIGTFFSQLYTRDHELEHVKNYILQPKVYSKDTALDDTRKVLNEIIDDRLINFDEIDEQGIYKAYLLAEKPEEKAIILTEYMRLKREYALIRAQDEIIAMFKVQVIYLNMNGSYRYGKDLSEHFLNQNGGFYDYLHNLRKHKGGALWQETAQKVLVEEYGHIIKTAIAAFERLVKNDFTASEAIGKLTDKKLAEWPKTVKRLLEQKEERQ